MMMGKLRTTASVSGALHGRKVAPSASTLNFNIPAGCNTLAGRGGSKASYQGKLTPYSPGWQR